jgi:hypothetical protein
MYAELGSPRLNLAYYTDEEICLGSSSIDPSCDEAFVITSATGESEDEDFEDLDEETPLPEGPSPGRSNRPPRSSDLSVGCLGDSGVLGKSLICDEGAWLSSLLNKWNYPKAGSLPQLLAESIPVEHDIEGWLSDTSSICGDDSYVRSEVPVC